ncbi:sigma-54 interaction domain-containing protein [Desulfobacula phenolica]|uniref:Arginine utilization regulatory protein n=1 Tax=Desulfobacula phenolica TaxID=90732 RepID=A0A1H2DMN9_9BACT|nr:sigma 54-interacting transcriptional regulator [Desulfobacula phenolica]SDT84155.1 arginine utilization regulatory protein [Desulfobacula phenolica]
MSFVENFDSSSLLDMEQIDFLSVLNRLDDGVIIADINGVILFYNAAQSKIDGLAAKDVIGRKVTEIYRLNNRTSMIMQAIERHAAIKNRAFFYQTCSGKVANTITSVYPLLKGKTINGVICLVKDYELLYRSTPMAALTESRPDLGNGTRYTFADLIGKGSDFQRVVGTARKAASSPSPIMIQGETGTGKELFAQSIHNHSQRRKQKYVGVNCAAIPRDLLEGLLFGTARGAFTGAMDKLGLFEIAHGGTLFLDELLAMPVDLQAKLLRVLQEKCVRRVGSAMETPVDVKIISSVSRDPRTAIREGVLRMDLFYRLGVVMVKLPPLRDRQNSMGELVSHFIEKYNNRLGTHVKRISREVLELFSAYQWPGNIRELEHLIEGAMNMAGREEIIGIEHFTPGLDCLEQVDFTSPEPSDFIAPGLGVPSFGEPDLTLDPDPPLDPAPTGNLSQTQADREKSAIKTALSTAGGNVTLASKKLGISRQLLHYKIKKHGLCRLDFISRPIR